MSQNFPLIHLMTAHLPPPPLVWGVEYNYDPRSKSVSVPTRCVCVLLIIIMPVGGEFIKKDQSLSLLFK